jgi:mgtE-like transporter
MNIFFGEAKLWQIAIFICVPCVACILAVSISIPVTSLIAIKTFKQGLDPDVIVYPILSSLNDIIVTFFFVLTIFLVFIEGVGWLILGSLFSITIILSCFIVLKNRKNTFFRKTLREGTPMVIISSLLGSLNGLFFSGIKELISDNPGLIVLYPSLTNALGNIGSIIGSRKTTDFALGYTKEFREDLKDAFSSILKIETSALLMHMIFALFSYLLASRQGAVLNELISIALISNLSSFLIISLFALGIAFIAYRRGLNPDNIVIPAITSTSDTLVTISLLPAVTLTRIFCV